MPIYCKQRCNFEKIRLLINPVLFIMKQICSVFGLAVMLMACGSNDTAKTNPTTQTAAIKKNILEADVVNGVQIVPLFADDNMKFNAKEVVVKVGIPIELTLKHTGKAPKKDMGHNVVILQPGVVFADFVDRANAAVATDYIPEEWKDKIVAHTKMLGGGETDVISFSFDKPGTYVFLCSFPGHSMMMKGKFVVSE
jgi:azurin